MTPREPLSTDRVLRAALTLADAAGTQALTMRRLGQELGVEAMSLYKHVANKDAILDGIVDLVVGEIALPQPGDGWKAAMHRRGVSAHEVLVRHRWACPLLMSRVNTGPAMLAYVDSTLGTLRAAGFSIELADHAWNAMDSHIYGHTMQRLLSPIEPQRYGEAAQEHLPKLRPDTLPHLTELGLHVAEGRYDGIVDVTFGLDLILDGLERLLDHQPAR
jgi:AcrR family transcriptional regulator